MERNRDKMECSEETDVKFVGARCLCAFHRMCVLKSFQQVFGVVFIYLGVFCNIVSAYNLDLETVTVHAGKTRSMFGYSVAFHEDQGSKWLLVGAPTAQTRQPGVTRGGAVYRCPIDSGSVCQEIPFDTKGNGIRHDGTHYRDVEDKSNQWFGASLYTSDNGVIVACAPRYVYFSTKMDKREPVGTCYVARSSSNYYEEYSPCRTRVDASPSVSEQYHQQGYCQLGFSATLTPKGRQLLIGAVGSWYWQGQLFNFNFEDGPGQYKRTLEGRPSDDNSYMGYSSAVGHFDEDKNEDYVVGVPRGHRLQGKVVIYNQSLVLMETIKGEQFGSYFGYAVAVTDLNGDGKDDIIVGAPLFTKYKSEQNTFETGRVYIYYQNGRGKFSRNRRDILEGTHTQGRYGQTLAATGDIDYDGYNDIAVGAPYGGDDGKGVVYIYHGSQDGIITDIQQEIKAEDVLSGISTFGWSLAGGKDMDDNEYPDLLIGSHESNTAVFMKSRPVVRVAHSLTIDPQDITLEYKRCVLPDQETSVTCINVYACIMYDGIGVPESLDFELTWKLDSALNDTSRVYYISPEDKKRQETKIVTIFKERNECFTTFAYLINNVRDKLTPIVVDFNFEIHEKKNRNKRDLRPILNQRIPTTAQAMANIVKECGLDNICIPDLAVTALHVKDSYTLGEDKKIELLVFVENRGEDSYESMLKVIFPPGVTFYKITNKKYEVPIFCDSSNSSFISCDLGNPLPAKSRTNFTLQATPKDINGSFLQLLFRAEVSSSNKENDTDVDNNVAEAVIPLQQAANLRIGGKSDPEQFIYTETDVRRYRQKEVGPEVEHEYILTNRGPSAVKTSSIKIDWPSVDLVGLNLLYLTEQPKVSRPDISCRLYNISAFSPKEVLEKQRNNQGGSPVEYSEEDGDSSVVNLNKKKAKRHNKHKHHEHKFNNLTRHRRETEVEPEDSVDKRDVKKRSQKEYLKISCPEQALCSYIHCTVGYLDPEDSVSIKVKGRVWTSTLIQKKIAEPFYFVSKATAEVLNMPFPDMKVAPSTLSKTTFEVSTYINPERLHPKRKGIEPWIIAVAVSSGLLLLLLLIILLWWCGFFRRRRPQEQAFLISQNGDFKNPDGPPDARYQYT